MTRLSTLLPFLTMTLLSACAIPGERASTADFDCPQGETCSPRTPEGLWFSGATFFDELFGSGPHTVAVGGTQTIRVHTSSNLAEDFSDPFHAEATPPFIVVKPNPPSVEIRAQEAGSGYLRIIDPNSSELYDRIAITAAEVSTMRLVPANGTWFDPEAANNLDWALMANGQLALGIILRDASDNRLVDESTTISISGAAVDNGSLPNWDTRSITVGPSGSVEAFVQYGGGLASTDDLPIVTTIEDVVIVKNLFNPNPSSSINVGTQSTFCFRGMNGNRAVAGLSWSIMVEGPITAEHVEESCFNVQAQNTGSASLTVSAGDFQKSFPLTIVKNAVAPAPMQIVAPRSPTASMPHAGDRSVLSRIATQEEAESR